MHTCNSTWGSVQLSVFNLSVKIPFWILIKQSVQSIFVSFSCSFIEAYMTSSNIPNFHIFHNYRFPICVMKGSNNNLVDSQLLADEDNYTHSNVKQHHPPSFDKVFREKLCLPQASKPNNWILKRKFDTAFPDAASTERIAFIRRLEV